MVTISRTNALLEAEVDGELIGLDVDHGQCYGFNGTATRIWALIEQPKSLEDLRDALMAEYSVDAATCQRQLVELLEELRAEGLVTVSGTLPPPGE